MKDKYMKSQLAGANKRIDVINTKYSGAVKLKRITEKTSQKNIIVIVNILTDLEKRQGICYSPIFTYIVKLKRSKKLAPRLHYKIGSRTEMGLLAQRHKVHFNG